MNGTVMRWTSFLLVTTCIGHAQQLMAGNLPFDIGEINKYLLVGMADDQVGDAIDADNVELGSHKAPAPISSSFAGNSAFGPSLLGNVPDIPLMALPVFGGIDHSGEIAVTHPQGDYSFSNAGIYASVGVQSKASVGAANDGTSNTFFYNTTFTDDPHVAGDGAGGFPNTLHDFGLANPGTNNNTTGAATIVPTGSVPSQYNIGENKGLVGNVNFDSLLGQINTAKTTIPQLAQNSLDGNGNPISFAEIDLSGDFTDGAIDKSLHPSDKGFGTSGPITASASSPNDGGTFKVTLQNTGLTVIDFDVASEKDITLGSYNFVIDGPLGSTALVRIPEGSSFVISKGNVLAGTGGIGLDNIFFAATEESTDSHFDFSNAVVNGVTFWDLGMGDSTINLSNVQGCAQFIGDKIDLSNVRLVHCGSGAAIPEPGSMTLVLIGGILLGAVVYRR